MNWWAGLTAWWSAQNWGSVPDWFAAVGTVGALVAALWLFSQERRDRKHQAADEFSSWARIIKTTTTQQKAESVTRSTTYTLEVEVRNNSSNPILRAALYVKAPRGRKLLAAEHVEVEGRSETATVGELCEIRPGESAPASVQVQAKTDVADAFLEFMDWRGKVWIRSLGDGKYRSPFYLKLRVRSRRSS